MRKDLLSHSFPSKGTSCVTKNLASNGNSHVTIPEVRVDSKNHTEIFRVTRAASEDWKDVGRELGFTEEQLSCIVREPGRTGERDYYSAMLGRWLDWAPPNHPYPSIKQLSAALREVGKEKLANDLDMKYGVSTK